MRQIIGTLSKDGDEVQMVQTHELEAVFFGDDSQLTDSSLLIQATSHGRTEDGQTITSIKIRTKLCSSPHHRSTSVSRHSIRHPKLSRELAPIKRLLRYGCDRKDLTGGLIRTSLEQLCA